MIDHDNLEVFADPVDYDRQDSSDTGVAFYAWLARETGGPVLELACGTGRVAIPIARQGFAVTGLDVIPGMLERALGAGTRAPRSAPRSRASRCATPSRRNSRRCCTTTALPPCGGTATGTATR